MREDGGTVMVCLEIASEGFLPRDVVMNLVTVDGLNATGIYMHHVFKDNIKYPILYKLIFVGIINV